MKFSHKQLCSGHMNSISVFLFPICISIETAQRVVKTLTVFWTKAYKKKSILWISFIFVCGTEL